MMAPLPAKDTLLVIFGAGASFDSLAPGHIADPVSFAFKPPLTKFLFEKRKLFNEFMTRYEETRIIASLIGGRVATGAPFEALLDEVVADSEHNPQLQKALMAFRFYLSGIFSQISAKWDEELCGVSNYCTLASRVETWRRKSPETRSVVYVTFNYDTLLEQALTITTGVKLPKLHEYINNDCFTLIKPHGSVGWVQPINGMNLDRPPGSEWIIQHAANVVASLGEPQKPGDGKSVPAIAIPLMSKVDFVCPKEHLNALVERIGTARRVATIGWAGKEKHFNALVRGKIPLGPRVAVAAGSIDEARSIQSELWNAWAVPYRGNELNLFASSFSTLVNDAGDQIQKLLYD